MPRLYNLITFLLLLGSVVILGSSLLIMANPQVPFNPFPPPVLPEALSIPSPTLTFTPSDTPTQTDTPTATQTFTPSLTFTPSDTPTQTATPSPTATDSPTATQTPSHTPVLPDLPTLTPSPTLTPDPNLPVSTEGISAQQGFVVPPNATDSPYPFVAGEIQLDAAPSCEYLGIAGIVLGLSGEPLINFPIEVGGEGFLEVRISGTAPNYGASGFEVNIGNRPVTTEFSVRLLGQTGEALSDYILIETGNTCQTNLTIITFQQIRAY